MSEDSIVKVKITYAKVLSRDSAIEQKEMLVAADKFVPLKTKQDFLNLLVDEGIPFPLQKEKIKQYHFARKSKKSKRYIPLESLDDFKCLARSLNVKGHIKLTINDHSPLEEDTKRKSSPSESPNDFFNRAGINLSSLSELITEVAGDKFREVLSEVTKEFATSFPPSTKDIRTEGETHTNVTPVLHHNACCDYCSGDVDEPIKGARFKCLVCPNYDLCEACENVFSKTRLSYKGHSYLHPTMKVAEPDSYEINRDVLHNIPSQSSEEVRIICDRCSNRLTSHQPSFRCTECSDFDLCPSCYNTHICNQETIGGHKPCHLMFEMGEQKRAKASYYKDDKSGDGFLDIDIGSCSTFLSTSVKSMLSDGVPAFVKKLERLFEDSRRFRELMDLVEVPEGSELEDDLKLTILKSLITGNSHSSFESGSPAVDETFMEDASSVVEEEGIGNNPPDYELINSAKEEVEGSVVHLKVKRFGPQSKIFSIQLINSSTHYFPPGDILFEFVDNDSREMIVVKNANAIAPSKSRFYNLKGEVEKFIGKNIKITSNNDDFVMQGVFNESESTLVVTRSRLPSFSRVTPMEESDSEAGNLEKVSVDLALKSNGMAQVTILNNTENAIDCSDLTIKVLNFLGNSICKVLVHKRHGIEPGKSSKFNIALNAAHLKHPFQLVLTNSDFRAVSDLSMKNLSGDFKVERGWSITNSKSPERSISEFDGSSSSTESEINESEFENFSKNNIGSTSSMVLPSLPKESIEKLSTSVYIDAKLDAERREEMGSVTESETDRSSRSPFQDKDQDMLIDVSDTDDFELGSDYEILTPTVSNYNYAG